MNVNTKQQNAKAWNDSLEKLNSAKAGQVQICYKDEQGNKRSGYIDIFDLQIVVEKKEMTFGKFLTELVNFNLDTQRRVETIAKGVASIKSDLMVVTVNELGFIKDTLEFNQTNDFIVQKQELPIDLYKGYYYVKDGVITIDETRKLELFPDYV
jgi:hypothetical protein